MQNGFLRITPPGDVGLLTKASCVTICACVYLFNYFEFLFKCLFLYRLLLLLQFVLVPFISHVKYFNLAGLIAISAKQINLCVCACARVGNLQ